MKIETLKRAIELDARIAELKGALKWWENNGDYCGLPGLSAPLRLKMIDLGAADVREQIAALEAEMDKL